MDKYEQTLITRETFEHLLTAWYELHAERYHRVITYRREFLQEELLRHYALESSTLLQWARDWAAKDENDPGLVSGA